MEIEVLVPVSRIGVEQRPLAARLDGLAGRRIGVLDNQKANAGRLLDHVTAELHRLGGSFDAVRQVKMATAAAPADVLRRLQRCEAVVLAIAD
jgi:hypothetical protein